MVDLCTLPMNDSPSFSCEVEQVIWLARNQHNPLVEAWWIGFEFAEKGRTFDRVIWRLLNGI